jgi:phage terminase large subunit-like protein
LSDSKLALRVVRSFRAETLDYVWLDEEPPIDIYTEALTRTNVGASPVWLTFTPLQGVSTVVKRFLHEKSEDRHNVVMTIDDVEHYSNDEKKKIIASYPPHEAEARIKGIPVLGSGRIFPVAEETIAIDNREFSRRTGRGSVAWTSVGINNLTLSVPAHIHRICCADGDDLTDWTCARGCRQDAVSPHPCGVILLVVQFQ